MANRLSDQLTFGEPELSGNSSRGSGSSVGSWSEEEGVGMERSSLTPALPALLTTDGTTPPSSSPTAKRLRKRQNTFTASTFHDNYRLTGEGLGRGAFACVQTCESILSGAKFAVKIVEKRAGLNRGRVIKEIETFHLCADHPNIVQLIEYFEEDDKFYMVFEKMYGGPLLNHIQRRIHFTEHEASMVVRDIATALKFLHDKGIAHRDVKPENVLCVDPERVSPVKLCDLDLASKSHTLARTPRHPITTPELQSPVGSAEFMAPEVVDAFVGESLKYDKRCDLWSLGVILYISLCGYPPFYGECWRENCGWDKGLPCNDCQESLFARIQKGEYDFPGQDWDRVSEDAKDLIRHLLVKDSRLRYSASEVLAHPFVTEVSPKTPLPTPEVLLRNDSARDLAQINENFIAVSRVLQPATAFFPAPLAPANRRPLPIRTSGVEGGRGSPGLFLPPRMSGTSGGGSGSASPVLRPSRCSGHNLSERLSDSSDQGLVVGAV